MVGRTSIRVVLAAALLFTSRSACTIFYGDEIGLTGHYEPGGTGGLPWDARDWNGRLLEAFRSLVSLRRSMPPSPGGYRHLAAEERRMRSAGLWRRAAGDGGECGPSSRRGESPLDAAADRARWAGERPGWRGQLQAEVPPRSAGVWRVL